MRREEGGGVGGASVGMASGGRGEEEHGLEEIWGGPVASEGWGSRAKIGAAGKETDRRDARWTAAGRPRVRRRVRGVLCEKKRADSAETISTT
jgi:hypothetical protein